MISLVDRHRLAGILGMLGSNSAGERDNAARLAEQFRHACGMTWIELLTPETKLLIVPAKPAEPQPEPGPVPWTAPDLTPVVANARTWRDTRATFMRWSSIVVGAHVIALLLGIAQYLYTTRA